MALTLAQLVTDPTFKQLLHDFITTDEAYQAVCGLLERLVEAEPTHCNLLSNDTYCQSHDYACPCPVAEARTYLQAKKEAEGK